MIKLKAINKNTKNIIIALETKFNKQICDINVFNNINDFILIEFTGAYDINNVEIYNGEIIIPTIGNFFNKYDNLTIFWNEDRCSFEIMCHYFVNKKSKERSYTLLPFDCDIILDNGLKIIGNEYLTN